MRVLESRCMEQLNPATGPLVKVRLYRAPMVCLSAAMMAGIAVGRITDLPAGLWLTLAGGGLVSGAVLLRRRWLDGLSVWAACLTVSALSAGWCQLRYHAASDGDIIQFTDNREILASIRGLIVSTPMTAAPPGPQLGYRRPEQTTFILRTTQIESNNGWRPATGLVEVRITQPDDRPQAGEYVELVGWLGRFEGPANPGQVDRAKHARQQLLRARFTIMSADGVTLLSSPAGFLARTYWRMRSAALNRFSLAGEGPAVMLAQAMLLGERHVGLTELYQLLARAGVAHYMSISGLHLGVLLGVVYLLCRLAGLSTHKTGSVVLAVLAGYLLLAKGRSPLLRSAIMACSLCISAMIMRRGSALNSLAMAAVVLLIVDPMELFDAGFQLSFATVAGMLVLHEPVRRVLFARFLATRGLVVFRGNQRIRRWLNYTAGNWMTSWVAVSIVAYSASAPLVAYQFGLFSPYAAVLTVLLYPLVAAVLLPGYLGLAVGWIAPNFAWQCNRLTVEASRLLAWSSAAMERLPGLWIDLRPVGVWWVLLTYAAMAGVVLLYRSRRRWFWFVPVVIIWAGATAWSQRPAGAPGLAQLNVLAVGAGQCVVLQTPSGQTWLIDAGSRSGFDVFNTTLWPFLRTSRLPMPKAAFISHNDADHFNAFPELLERHRLKRLYVSGYFSTDGPGDPLCRAWARRLADRMGEGLIILHAGDIIRLDDRTSIEVYWPVDGLEGVNSNNTSLVLRLVCDDRSVLLPGDVEVFGQSRLMELGWAIKSDVMLLPHHGSWKPTLLDLLAAVDPDVVIVSNSRDPGIVPSANGRVGLFWRRLTEKRRYYATQTNGLVRVSFGGGKVEVTTMK